MLANMFHRSHQIPMDYLRSLKRSDSSPNFTSNNNKKDESTKITTTNININTSSNDRQGLMESSSSSAIPINNDNSSTNNNHNRTKSIDENNVSSVGRAFKSKNQTILTSGQRRATEISGDDNDSSLESTPSNILSSKPSSIPSPLSALPPPPPPPPPPPSLSSSVCHSNNNNNNGPPIPYTKRLLRHQSSLNDEDNCGNNNGKQPQQPQQHGMLSKSSSKASSSTCSYQNQSSTCSVGENDGPLDECSSDSNNINNNYNSSDNTAVLNDNCNTSIGSLYQKSKNNSNSNSISNLRESNLNLNNSSNNNSTQQRPPAVRSLSSASSLFPSNNQSNNNHSNSASPTKSFSGNPANNYRQQRRGAMVSCENLLSDSPELYGFSVAAGGGGSGAENAFKNFKNSSRKIGGMFSNPFKSDTEKLEQLNELLQKYSEMGIPDPKHVMISNIATSSSTNKLNHLRASSLSISGLLSGNSSGIGGSSFGGGGCNLPAAQPTTTTTSTTPGNSNQGLLSTAKTSLSTTDLYRMNYNYSNNNNNSNGSSSMLSTPQQHHYHSQNGQLLLSSASFDSSLDSYYYLEPEWRNIVENADQLPPRIQSQNEAIWELLKTEVSYIRRLKVINDVFIACLLNLQNEGLLTEIDRKCVFSNITEVYEANHDFWIHYLLPMLNHSREKKCPLDPTMMKDGFLKFDQIFRPYRQYFFDLSKCTQYLKDKCKTNNLFRTYITWCETHKDCERLGLADFLAKPMQRLLKYELLLQAILKKTDNEIQKECLEIMENRVKQFVTKLNESMTKHQQLSSVVTRIESYDAIDCNNDEAEKFLKDYLYLDLMQSMPGCSTDEIRHLYREDTLKLKDSTNKQDVHCFLFTDVFLVCKPLNKKSNDGRMKVIRQPFITDRLIVHELKDGLGFLLIYLNELKVAGTYMLLFTTDSRSWVDAIRRAQDDYKNLKFISTNEQQQYYQLQQKQQELLANTTGTGTTYHSYDDDFYGNVMMFATSPRSSSRSSLIHSHSGSQDIGDQTTNVQLSTSPMVPSTIANTTSSNQLSIQQSPRAISFELGDLRNPSLVVEDADSFSRSQSFDNRSPMVTITSPRHDRRAFLRNQQQSGKIVANNKNTTTSSNGTNVNKTNVDLGGGANVPSSHNYLYQNSLSVNVPYIQPPPVVQTQPIHQTRQTRRSVPNISDPSNSSSSIITLNEMSSPNSATTIQVAVHPPPPSPSPPPLVHTSPSSIPSPSKRSPSKSSSMTGTSGTSNTTINRPLPPLPPSAPSNHIAGIQSTTTKSSSALSPSTSIPPPPPPPPSLMSISSRSAPGPMTMTINKPPLVKTKNVSYGVASMSYAPDKTSSSSHQVMDQNQNNKNPLNIQVNTNSTGFHENTVTPSDLEFEICDNIDDSIDHHHLHQNQSIDDGCGNDGIDGDDSKNRYSQQQQKRTYRPDRRYHTADSIEQFNKEKDNSIHKRLSWNYGQQQQHNHHHNQSGHHHHQHHHHNHHHQPGCMHYDHHLNNQCSSIYQNNSNNQLLQPRSLASSASISTSTSSTSHHNYPASPNKCLSTESVCCSSGFSSTGSVPLSVGSDQSGGCCCCNCCLSDSRLRLQEEEEDLIADDDVDDFKHHQHPYHHHQDSSPCSTISVKRNPSDSSDRDSALPVSPALNDSMSMMVSMSPVHGSSAGVGGSVNSFHHSHSNSQCSMESCGGGNGDDTKYKPITSSTSEINPKNLNSNSDIKIEMKDGIQSVKITLAPNSPSSSSPSSNSNNQVSIASKSDLKKMREFLLSDCNMESSEV